MFPHRLAAIALLLNTLVVSTPVAATSFDLMFERVSDIPGGTELAFLRYDDREALLNNTPSGLDEFSPIDIAPIFSTTGLTSVWSGDPAPVPTPGSVPLLVVAAAALVAVTARSRAAAAPLTGGCALRRP